MTLYLLEKCFSPHPPSAPQLPDPCTLPRAPFSHDLPHSVPKGGEGGVYMRRKSVKHQRQIKYSKSGNVPEGFGRTEIQVTQGDRNKHSRLLCKVFMGYFKHKGFPGGSVEKNHLPMQKTQEMRVWSLGGEDSLEEEMVTHSNILAWKIPWTEEPGGLQSQTQLSDWAHTRVHTHTHTHGKYRKSS